MFTANPAKRACLLLVLASGAADATGTLYKCSDPKGAISLQSDPCPAGSTQVWKRATTPEPEPTAEQQAAGVERRQREAEAARALSRLAGTSRDPPAPRPPAPAVAVEVTVPETPVAAKGPCRQAHELQDGIRANPWLEMRDDQLYRLGEWVARQCRDPDARD